jgi:ATP-dependent Lon protease
MQESARAALSYVRSSSSRYKIDDEYWDKHDIHLHVPAGAQPKDGPSAGVTMAVALASLATGAPVKPDVGMTGEVTLRGRVLPIGGVKEKVLAAHRAGLKSVILPKRNELDLDDVPDDVREEMEFIFADCVDDVIENALVMKPTKSTGKKRTKSTRSSTAVKGSVSADRATGKKKKKQS